MKHQALPEEDSQQDLLRKPENINLTRDGHTVDLGNNLQAEKKKRIIKYSIIGAIVAIILILIIVLPIVLTKKDNPPTPPPPPPPVPPPIEHYNPYVISDQDVQKDTFGLSGVIRIPNQQDQNEAFRRILNDEPKAKKYGVKVNTMPKGVNNQLRNALKFSFGQTTWKVGHFVLTTDGEPKRYSIPDDVVPNPPDDKSMRLDMTGINVNTQGSFYFTITDPLDKENVYINTKDQTLVFYDKYIQMDFILPSQRLFGFGERVREFQLQEGTWTMWASGQNSPYDDGTGRRGAYGVHPFVLVQGKKKDDFFGMFFRNSNAQSPIIKYTPEGKTLLSYITIGGNIEIFFFMHGSAKDVISSYQNYFGKPRLPPFWSLGWQQAAYAYANQKMVDDVIDAYKTEGFPLETVYLDIPYMKDFLDFTVDTDKFPTLPAMADKLHKNNQNLVLIIDAGISAMDLENKYYKLGNDANAFIKSGMYKSEKYNNNLLLDVWQPKTVFVDWFNDKCMDMWSTGLNDLYEKVPYDGIWIDMNEPTGFHSGELDPSKEESDEPKVQKSRFLTEANDDNIDYNWYKQFPNQDQESTWFLPFVPRYDDPNEKGEQVYGNWDNWTISLNATHAGLNGEKEYNVHSLYGHMMARRTYEFLTNDEKYPKKAYRPFIITRSNFASSGRYTSHWLGDNFRSWDWMRYSIAGVMNMNMFGIPHVGPDICGFFGIERNDELCARWTQLATFYPLARFHYVDNSKPNEPYLMEGKFKDIAKQSMFDRYQYLRHLYTCMYEASANGASCYDPLFYYFPTDDKVYENIESSIMVGGAIKVSPILTQLKAEDKTFKAYFPKGKWVDLVNPKNVIDASAGGDFFDLPTDQNSVHTHLKEGSMISFQDNSDNKVFTTKDLQSRPISLVANRDGNGYAYGSLFLDKGIARDELDELNFEYYQLHLQANSIQNVLVAGNRGRQDHILDQVKIHNAKDLENVNFACYLDMNMKPQPLLAFFDETTNSLVLSVDQGSLKFNQFQAIHFGNSKTDVNLCGINSYNYKIKGGAMPDLSQSSVTLILENIGSTVPDIQLDMRVLETKNIVNVKWTWAKDEKGNFPPAGKREPREVPDEFITTKNLKNSKDPLSKYLKVTDNPFTVQFMNREDPPTPYYTITGMLFDEYYNQINARVNSKDANFQGIFGLGERANNDFFFKDGVYGMWARDSLTPTETGRHPGNNMYGTHPFFMYKFSSNNWVGVLYNLANAQDWWITNNKDKKQVDLKTIATGGVADIYVMTGTKPDVVVQNYFTLIGNPVLVPQWALGWNQCKWGYTSLQALKDVVSGYKDNALPLDVQWSDIDYMNKYRNWEYDKQAFNGLPQFIKELNDKNMKWVPILDAGLAKRDGGDYEAYNEGVGIDAFMKINNEIFIGEVWPNDAAYPDFFNPKVKDWYHKYLSKMHDEIPFSGLWEDMNEASNFCNGVCYPSQKPAHPVKQNLKYIPTGRDLEFKSMALDAYHSNGYLQLDTHSYYGAHMVKTTHEWFESKNMRTFIIERSSFAGMGKYGSRWLGDNFSDEQSMSFSVSGTMLMNMFGITLAGSDICGFIGNTNDELCTKWTVVGAFYPFSRNHNNWGQTPQEPYTYKDKKLGGRDILPIMRNAIKIKYSLIRYYYSNLFQISTEGTGTFYKPLFFEFPDDPKAYDNIVYNVMLGDSLKLSINPEQLKIKTYDYYFPAGLWCGIGGTFSDTESITGKCLTSTGESKVTLPAYAWDYQLHIRQGKIVPMQDTFDKEFSTSVELQSWPVDLHVLGSGDDKNWNADGVYYNDDGVTLKYEGLFNKYTFRASSSPTLSFKVSQDIKSTKTGTLPNCNDINSNDLLNRIFFYNAKGFNNNKAYTVNAIMVSDATPKAVGEASYDDKTDRLVFTATAPICLTDLKELQFTPKA